MTDKTMTIGELRHKIRDIIPLAQFEYDNYGQIVIYTDLQDGPDNTVVKFDDSDEDENVVDMHCDHPRYSCRDVGCKGADGD